MEDISYEKWAAYLCSFFEKGKKSRIFEIGCGTGSLSIALKKMGHDVIASDISHDMLEIASQKARKAGLKIPFIYQDARCIEINKKADVVIAACDVLNYIGKDNLLNLLLNIRTILEDDGRFIFDISSEHKLLNTIGDNTFFEDDEDCTYIWNNEHRDDKIIMDLILFIKEGSKYIKHEEQHVQYIYRQRELIKKLEENGFSVQSYAFLSEKEANENTQRIQFVCKKRELI